MAKSAVPGVLFPLNGQYCTAEDFVRRIEHAIDAAHTFATGVAKPIDHKVKQDIKKLISERFKQD